MVVLVIGELGVVEVGGALNIGESFAQGLDLL